MSVASTLRTQLDWSVAAPIRAVRLFDRPNPDDHTQADALTCSDGSSIDVAGIANDGRMKTAMFDTNTVTWVRFQVTAGQIRNLGDSMMTSKKVLVLMCLLATMFIGPAHSAAAENIGADTKQQSPGSDNSVPDTARPLKVFILSGQSNMQGQAHVRTFAAMALDPKTAPILKEMQDADGTPRVCQDVWISSIGCAPEEQVGKLTAGFGAKARGPKIGPEFTFGIYIEKLLGGPVLIIKTAWGGKSLHTDFRPPSAETYEFNEAQLEQFKKQGKDIEAIKSNKAEATGRYYRLMMDHVKKVLADIKRVYPDYDPKQGYELAGFVWFQGWNDMVDRGTYPSRDKPGGYDKYGELLAQFIRDVRKDLGAPKMPFVIGVMGVGGPVDKYGPEKQRYKTVHQNFRMAMAAPATLPELQGNVAAVFTEKYWDMDVVALRRRERKIKPQVDEIKKKMKQSELSREEGNAAVDKLYADTFTPRELAVLKESTSNFDFHYMGSAKVMAQIGKGFAEAMAELSKKNASPAK